MSGRQFLYLTEASAMSGVNPHLPTAGGMGDPRVHHWEAEYRYWLADQGPTPPPVLVEPITEITEKYQMWDQAFLPAHDANMRWMGLLWEIPSLETPNVIDIVWDDEGKGWSDRARQAAYGSRPYRLWAYQSHHFYYRDGKQRLVNPLGPRIRLNRVGTPFLVLVGRYEPAWDDQGKGYIISSNPYSMFTWKGQIYDDELRRFERFSSPMESASPKWWGRVEEIYVGPEMTLSAAKIKAEGVPIGHDQYLYQGHVYLVDGSVVTKVA